MELIVLGTQAAYAGATRACSGYLLKKGKTKILLEIGTGVLSNLFKWIDPSELSALVITHLHTDHFLDIYPLRYFLEAKTLKFSLPVFGPRGSKNFIGRLLSKEGFKNFSEVFKFKEIADKVSFKVGEVKLDFFKEKHLIPSFGVSIGKKLVYSSDTAYHASLVKWVKEAENFLCEATLQDEIFPGHLTAREAGKIAQKGGVKRLILTHIWPSYDSLVSKNQAEAVFKGEVILAKENEKYQL